MLTAQTSLRCYLLILAFVVMFTENARTAPVGTLPPLNHGRNIFGCKNARSTAVQIAGRKFRSVEKPTDAPPLYTAYNC